MAPVPADSIPGHLLSLGKMPRPKPRDKGEAINYIQSGTVRSGLIVGDVRHNEGTGELDYYLLHEEDRRDPGFGWVSGEFLKTDKQIEQIREEERREADKKVKKAKRGGKCVFC